MVMLTSEIIKLLLAGGAGALIKDIVSDNGLEIPKISEGKLSLGFFGGLLLGAVAGFYIDGSIETAFLAGLSASTIITGLIGKKITETAEASETIPEMIKRIAREQGVDPELAYRVAKCESGFNPKARNINSPDSIDRGLFQINSKYHPEVTDGQADDPEFATRWFCTAVKQGHIDWWNASKACWDTAIT
jgi:hypothetical protein